MRNHNGLGRRGALAALRSPLTLNMAMVALLLASPIAVTLFLYAKPEANRLLFDPEKHFYLVSGGALASLAIGASTIVGSFRLGNTRLLLMGLAFLGGAGFYIIHGLTTPGFILHGTYHTAALSEGLALLWAAVLLAAASLDPPDRINAWINSKRGWLLAGVIILLAAYGVVGTVEDELVRAFVPDQDPLFAWSLAATVLLLMGIAAYRTLQSYLISGLAVQGAWLAGIFLLMQSQAALALVPRWHLAWWLYHAFVLAGFLVILYGTALEYARGRSLSEAVSDVALPDTATEIKRGYNQAILALAAAAEARDNYTEGHLTRVADLALRIGQEMGLPRSRFRALTQGALLHDIGKLKTPDAILGKPAKLTAEETVLMRQHSTAGYELLRRIPGCDREAVIARHHHEWWDGTGYPDGLAGEEIPLESRIVAVADTYDAMTTDRPYRPAVRHQQALAVILQEAGNHLDPACVAAFLRIASDRQAAEAQSATERLAA